METIHGDTERTLELAVQHDLSVLVALGQQCGDDLVLFLFGSAAQHKLVVNDLDVFALFERAESVRAFRRIAMSLNLVKPLHLVAMTAAEEQYYRFIDRTHARRIADLQCHHVAG
jgi:hypothetical protein